MVWATNNLMHRQFLPALGLSCVLVARLVYNLRRVRDGNASDLQDAAGGELHGDVAVDVGS